MKPPVPDGTSAPADQAPTDSPAAADAVVTPPPSGGASPLNTFIYLALLTGLGVLLYKYGLDGVFRGFMVLIGLGFVIFIHELGHFLAAKWCDVHIQTFSIGFGPALPGCSFTRGETTYKLAVIPLGGYVNMVGEGPEADEDENYPRSFKNKSVLQRMLIISAGVIMNVLFGAVCFVVVYYFHGMPQEPAVVWNVEPGSPAWKASVRPGWKITRLDGKENPWFNDLRRAVALSREGQQIPFSFEALPGFPEAPSEPIDLEPFRDQNNSVPAIGVAPASSTQLLPERYKRQRSLPVLFGSAARWARVLELDGTDVPVAVVDAETGKVKAALPDGPKGWLALCDHLRGSEDEITVRVRGKDGKTRDVQVPADGFHFGDRIVGTTNPASPDQPYNLEPLPLDANPPDPNKPRLANAFVFRERMRQLAGKPAVLQVKRAMRHEGEEGKQVSILVPPAYHHTFGMVMQMGKVAAVRAPAEKQVEVGDVIVGASLRYNGGKWGPLPAEALDPVRLPYELDRRVHADAGRDPTKWEVRLTVERTVAHNPRTRLELGPLKWDDSWKLGDEAPATPAAPMSIPQLGIAYRVECTIRSVKPGSPAARAGLEEGDIITAIRFREAGKTPTDKKTWSDWLDTFSVRDKEKPYDQWAHYFWLLEKNDFPEVEVKVRRKAADYPTPFELTGEPDTTWPLPQRGLLLLLDRRQQKAGGLVEAVGLGMSETWQFIEQIYLNLTRLLSGRISKKTLGGPLTIASQAFGIAGEDLFLFLLYLGIISVNLAVVNFLPIPVLDGGHMVFLIYEGVRGKPPSDTVRAVATYAGLAFILLLMLFVLSLDAKRVWPNYFYWLPF